MILPALLAAAEVAGLALAAFLLFRLRRRFVQARAQAADFWTALEESASEVIGSVPARLLVGEPKIWAALFLWISRRHRRDPRAHPYSAASRLGLIVVVVLGLILLEGAVGGFVAGLTPLSWLSPVLIGVSAYAALWIVGIYASLRAFPHLVTQHGLLLRYGVLAEAWIPWEDLAGIDLERLASPGGQDGLSVSVGTATLAVGGVTSVTVRRLGPGTVKGFLRSCGGITHVRVAADHPLALLDAVDLARAREGRLEERVEPP